MRVRRRVREGARTRLTLPIAVLGLLGLALEMNERAGVDMLRAEEEKERGRVSRLVIVALSLSQLDSSATDTFLHVRKF